jgi:hypothetical protein
MHEIKPPDGACPKCWEEAPTLDHQCNPLDVAGIWLSTYLMAQDEVEITCAIESLGQEPDEHWNARTEFIAACFAAGVSPAPYADEIIDHQRSVNRLLQELDDEDGMYE